MTKTGADAQNVLKTNKHTLRTATRIHVSYNMIFISLVGWYVPCYVHQLSAQNVLKTNKLN
jgi:hypothetical protein